MADPTPQEIEDLLAEAERVIDGLAPHNVTLAIHKLAAALRSLCELRGMDSAPRDGTPFLAVLHPDVGIGPVVAIGYDDPHPGIGNTFVWRFLCDCKGIYCIEQQIIGWLPLPVVIGRRG